MDQGQRQTDSERRETGRRAGVGRAHDHEQETGGQHQLGYETGY